MKNVTMTLDEEVARWARIRAAEKSTSVSKLVGELLREHMEAETGYEAAMKSYLSKEPRKLRRRGRGSPSREERHERESLR